MRNLIKSVLHVKRQNKKGSKKKQDKRREWHKDKIETDKQRRISLFSLQSVLISYYEFFLRAFLLLGNVNSNLYKSFHTACTNCEQDQAFLVWIWTEFAHGMNTRWLPGNLILITHSQTIGRCHL